jgi:hypothetical protein
MRASSGGPPNRKNKVSGMTVSPSISDLVTEIAVLSPSTDVTMAGLPATTEPPWVSRPARSATASTRSNISRSGRNRGSICRSVCGARASQSLAGPQAALMALAADTNTTSITMATARPRRRPQRCRRSTAGVSSSARKMAMATGISTSCAKYRITPSPMSASSHTAFTSFGSGRSSCAFCMRGNVGDPSACEQLRAPQPCCIFGAAESRRGLTARTDRGDKSLATIGACKPTTRHVES